MDTISKKKKLIHGILYWGLPILAIAGILCAWIIFSNNNPELFPTPAAVWERFIRTFTKPISKTNLLGHAWASLKRVLIALLLSWSLGIVFGVMIGWNKVCNAVLGSIFELLRPIPPIAWIPIMVMWMGIGELPKVILVFIGTFSPVVINTASGIKLVDPINIHVGKIFGANTWQTLKEIVVPTALPSIFAGMRTSVSSGWTTVLAAEMMGAQTGLGSLVTRGWQGSDMSLVLVSVIAIAIIGALLSGLTQRVEKAVCPWMR